MESKERAPYFAAFLDLRDREVLIVGGGEVAARKIHALLDSGARVTVIALDAVEAIRERSGRGEVSLLLRRFEARDVEGKALVVAATNDAAVNGAVRQASRRLAVWTNVADDPEECDFIVPSVVQRGSIQVAVSTGGSSPALARDLRRALEAVVGPEWSEAAEWLALLRTAAKSSLPADHRRKNFFEAILAVGLVDLLRLGRREEARQAVGRVCLEWGVSVETLPTP